MNGQTQCYYSDIDEYTIHEYPAKNKLYAELPVSILEKARSLRVQAHNTVQHLLNTLHKEISIYPKIANYSFKRLTLVFKVC